MGIAYSITRQHEERDGHSPDHNGCNSVASSDAEESTILDYTDDMGVANSVLLRNSQDVDGKNEVDSISLHESILKLQREIWHSRTCIFAFRKNHARVHEKMRQICRENSVILQRILDIVRSNKITIPRQRDLLSFNSTHPHSFGQKRLIKYVHIHIQ
jgi:hypothetical protein